MYNCSRGTIKAVNSPRLGWMENTECGVRSVENGSVENGSVENGGVENGECGK